MNIPKNMFHIWVGPLSPPLQWMNTWTHTHSDWTYKVIDNDFLNSFDWHNKNQIFQYYESGKYSGVADLIRYELLYHFGGFIPPSDAVSHHSTNDLWNEDADCCYTVYENEILRPGYVSPIYACNPKNKFVEIIIDEMSKVTRDRQVTEHVWEVTGNAYLARAIAKHQPKIKIFPSHYFIPQHFTSDQRYAGPDKVYADQMWGTTKKSYGQGC